MINARIYTRFSQVVEGIGVVSHLQIYMKFRKMKTPTCYGKAGWGNYDRFCFHQKISDCELQWILLESVEYSAQITLAGIWQEGYNLLALILRTLRNLGGCKGGGT